MERVINQNHQPRVDQGGNACKDTVSDKAACTDEIDGTTYCRRSIKLNFLCNNEISDIPQFEEVEEARGCEYEVRDTHRRTHPRTACSISHSTV